MADTDDIQERIRRRAHELWENEGRPHGRDADHWSQAEAEVRGAGALEPTGKVAGSRKKTATSKATGKSTRAAAESLSEVASAPAESAKSEPAKQAKAKPAAPKAKADAAPAEEAASVKAPAKATPKAAAGKTTAKSPAAKPPRASKKDGGKSATAG
jgi:hypothetical protein